MVMLYDTRAAWGAKPPQGAQFRWTSGRPVGVAIHYVGGAGSIGLAGKDHSACLATMRSLQSYAMRGGNGWTYSDIEYNLAACPHGHVIEARGVDLQGAAQKGANATHASIVALANVADPIDGTPLAQAVNDAVALIQNHYPAATQVVGHRDTAGNPTGTNCPGDAIENWIHAGRTSAAAVTPPAPAPVPQEDIMYVTYQGQLHGFYVSKDAKLWQRWEAGDGHVQEKNVSAAVGFGPVNAARTPEVHEAPNGDLIVGVYGSDGVFNEARWIKGAATWSPHTYR
jgi:hypothetical protein